MPNEKFQALVDAVEAVKNLPPGCFAVSCRGCRIAETYSLPEGVPVEDYDALCEAVEPILFVKGWVELRDLTGNPNEWGRLCRSCSELAMSI